MADSRLPEACFFFFFFSSLAAGLEHMRSCPLLCAVGLTVCSSCFPIRWHLNIHAAGSCAFLVPACFSVYTADNMFE